MQHRSTCCPCLQNKGKLSKSQMTRSLPLGARVALALSLTQAWTVQKKRSWRPFGLVMRPAPRIGSAAWAGLGRAQPSIGRPGRTLRQERSGALPAGNSQDGKINSRGLATAICNVQRKQSAKLDFGRGLTNTGLSKLRALRYLLSAPMHVHV